MKTYELTFEQPTRGPGDSPHSGPIVWEPKSAPVDVPSGTSSDESNRAAIFIAQNFISRLPIPNIGPRGEPVRVRNVVLKDDDGNEIWREDTSLTVDPMTI